MHPQKINNGFKALFCDEALANKSNQPMMGRGQKICVIQTNLDLNCSCLGR